MCAPWRAAAAAYRASPATVSAWSVLLSLVGALGAHAFGNIVNTYGDFIKGLDRADNGADDRALVDGSVTTRQVKVIMAACLAVCLGALFTLAANVAHLKAPPAADSSLAPLHSFLLLASAGVFLAYSYTGWPLYLKYRRLGDVAIFLSFGPLLVSGAYFVQTGRLSVPALCFSLPVGLLTEAVLHANNARDIAIDRKAGAKTLANTIGFAASEKLFHLLYAVSFAALPVYALWMRSVWFLLPALTLPQLPALLKQFHALDTKGGAGAGTAKALGPHGDRDRQERKVAAGGDPRATGSDTANICDQCGQFSSAFGVLLAIAIVIG